MADDSRKRDFGPFTFHTPSWVNTRRPVSVEAALARASSVAPAIYPMLTQTGIHAVIEWCGVIGEHTKMLEHAWRVHGVDPADVNQHGSRAVPVPAYMVEYFAEKVGCQIKPFIRADPELWRGCVERWFGEDT